MLSEVYRWRVGATCFWQFVLCPLVSIALLAIYFLETTRPVASFAYWLSLLVSFQFWVFSGVAALLFTLSTLSFAPVTSVNLEMCKTRAQLLLKPVSTRFWSCIGFHCLVGAVTALLIEKLFHHTSSEDKDRIDGPLGFWIGLYFTAETIWKGRHIIRFPLIQQHRLFRLKNKLWVILTMSVETTIKAIKSFYCVNIIGSIFSPVFFGINDIIKLSVFVHCVILAIYLTTSWNIGQLLLMTFITEGIVFPIKEDCVQQQPELLTKALTATHSPLVQHLAYLDLARVAHTSCRRQVVFSLSQPGNQPKVWQIVWKECTRILNDLTAQLGVKLPDSTAPAPQVQSIPSVVNHQQGWCDSPLPSLPNGQVMYRRNLGHHATELWSASPASHGQCPTIGRENFQCQQMGVPQDSGPAQVVKLLQMLTSIPRNASANLKKRPVISYFFSELADFDKDILLANCQCHLWAVQALSALVAASYEEDRYGVVQKDLCTIVSSLLWLLEGIKQYTKQPISAAHQDRFMLKFELRSALQQGLTDIAIRFRDHVKDLSLPPERLECFSQFLIDK